MGQYWMLLNIDERTHTGHLGKLGECILSFPIALNKMLQSKKVSLLSEPDPAVLRDIMKATCIPDETALGSDRPTPFFDRLSTEMVGVVIENFEHDVPDMICFGLCSRRLWQITRPRLEACLNRILAPSRWAGDRIICVGDYAEDLPKGMLAEGELEALASSAAAAAEDDEDDEDDDDDDNLYFIAASWQEVRSITPHSFTRPLEERGVTPKSRDWLLWKHFQEPWTAKPAAPLILRNLTSREYVRETALQKWRQRNKGKLEEVEDVTLGHICGFRICWSSDVDSTMKTSLELERGVWAGHRFDIVSETEWVPEKEPKSGTAVWRDVSKETLAEVGEIWEAAYH